MKSHTETYCLVVLLLVVRKYIDKNDSKSIEAYTHTLHPGGKYHT